MTTLVSRLTPEVAAQLKALMGQEEVQEKPQVADLPPVTTINGVDVDLRSEGMFATECPDCGCALEVVIAPKGVDLAMLTSQPRVAVCTDCGRARVANKQGVVVHRAPVTQPVESKPVPAPKLRLPSSDADLAALVGQARDRMVAEQVAAMPEARRQAVLARVDAEALQVALSKVEQAERKASGIDPDDLPSSGQDASQTLAVLDPAQVAKQAQVTALLKARPALTREQATRIVAGL